ncbi:MAG: hypothetical protein JW729_09930, partial [Bacteroidales bacterium]|nr:hypothetical protein [Bacteroidales bacterium]
MRLIYNKRLFIFQIGIVFLFLSCNQEGTKEKENPVFINSRQKMWEVNAALIDQEEAIIQRYVDRYGWKMNKTETGLRWMI